MCITLFATSAVLCVSTPGMSMPTEAMPTEDISKVLEEVAHSHEKPWREGLLDQYKTVILEEFKKQFERNPGKDLMIAKLTWQFVDPADFYPNTAKQNIIYMMHPVTLRDYFEGVTYTDHEIYRSLGMQSTEHIQTCIDLIQMIDIDSIIGIQDISTLERLSETLLVFYKHTHTVNMTLHGAMHICNQIAEELEKIINKIKSS